MTWQEQARQGMAYRMAHSLWFARMIVETRAGRSYKTPAPKIKDFMKATP